MPTLKDFGAFKITMYFGDHPPPHVHVLTPDQRGATIAIRDGRVLQGKLPPAVERKARAWIAANRAMLLNTWNEMT